MVQVHASNGESACVGAVVDFVPALSRDLGFGLLFFAEGMHSSTTLGLLCRNKLLLLSTG